MKLLGVRSIWRISVFWTVYVRSSVDQMSYKCRKHDVNNDVNDDEQTEPLYSVLDNNLVSCAVTCYTNNSCLYFVYTSHNKRCDGYDENRCDGGEDGGTAGTSVGNLLYKHTCKKRCEKRKAKYKIYIRTGRGRNAGSKADVVLSIIGKCGRVSKELTNGKDVRLRKGHRSTLKFIADSVCRVRSVGLVFSDPCNKDDWFVEYVGVITEEMKTGKRGKKRFQTKCWLGAYGDDDSKYYDEDGDNNYCDDNAQATGITCTLKHGLGFYFSVPSGSFTTCSTDQTCE